MITHSLHRKDFRKLIVNPKGFSSVIGTTFMVLVMLVLASSIFLWTLSKNTEYFQAMKEKNQLEMDRLNERLSTENVNYTVSGDVVSVEVNLKNEGSLPVHLTTLWVLDTTIRKYGFNDTLNINLKPGEILTIKGTEAIKVFIEGANNTHIFSSWFITARGNAVPLEKESGIIVAQVSAGIGAIAMNFNKFKYYNVSKVGSSYILNNYPQGGIGYVITQPASGGIAFEVSLINFDPGKRTITLYSSSVLFTVFPVLPQQPRGSMWYIVNVNTNGVISNTYTPIQLAYGVETSVFFASAVELKEGNVFSPAKAEYTGTAPVNIALVGKIGNDYYGQNIPFTSVYIKNP